MEYGTSLKLIIVFAYVVIFSTLVLAKDTEIRSVDRKPQSAPGEFLCTIEGDSSHAIESLLNRWCDPMFRST